MKTKRNHRWIWVALGVVVLALAAWSTRPSALPVRVAQVRRGLIQAYVDEAARTTLPHVYHLTMPQNGRIQPITVREGDSVTQGQVVAVMDLADLQDSLREANAAVTAIQAAVLSSQAKITASKAYEDYAEWVWKAQERLYDSQDVSEMSAREAQRDFIGSQVDFQQDQFQFHAMGAIQAMVQLLPIYYGRQLQRATLASPIAGTVLQRFVDNERELAAGDALLDIGDVNALEVTADLLSDDVVSVTTGDTVQIYGSAVGDRAVTGTVRRIHPEGFTKTSSLGVEQQRVPVVVAFQPAALTSLVEADRRLGVEYRVRVRIFTAEHDQALIIPITALFRNGAGDGWLTYVVRHGRAALVPVALGLSNDNEAEVIPLFPDRTHDNAAVLIAGLAAGDQVIDAPDAALASGARVKPAGP